MVSNRDPSTRARDSDRDRIVAQLDDAFVDGQLSDADRDLRVTRALAARTLGDLDTLVRDLQATSSAMPLRPSRRTLAVVGTTSAAVLLVIVGMVFQSGDEPYEPVAGDRQPVEVEQPSSAPTPEPTAEQTQEPRPDSTANPLTRRHFQDFQDAYEEKFGGTRIWDAGYYEAGYVVFKRPFSRKRKDLLQNWDWYPDRGFKKSIIDASANVFDYAPFDLTTVNYKALARHVVQGRKYLGVTNPEMRVSMAPTTGDLADVIDITASNSHGDYGTRYVAPGGRLIDSFPFVVGSQ